MEGGSDGGSEGGRECHNNKCIIQVTGYGVAGEGVRLVTR